MFLKDDFTGKSTMFCAFETICKSVFPFIILKDLVRGAGVQKKTVASNPWSSIKGVSFCPTCSGK